ncbi:hypothetical protein SAMN05518847_1011107 [Paenibacillus sp. OV219]|nr:hypothetical protein SAMN05518847_1011107 [Paenibacillus sp. OV219]
MLLDDEEAKNQPSGSGNTFFPPVVQWDSRNTKAYVL